MTVYELDYSTFCLVSINVEKRFEDTLLTSYTKCSNPTSADK